MREWTCSCHVVIGDNMIIIESAVIGEQFLGLSVTWMGAQQGSPSWMGSGIGPNVIIEVPMEVCRILRSLRTMSRLAASLTLWLIAL